MKEKIPVITWDPEYFQTTVRKESRYPLAWRWVKETLQNAIDAKATEIIYTLDTRDLTFEVKDNGVGMDAKCILEKFLSIGGSKKKGKSIGGFGDAKKVICLCWERWELDSNGNYLSNDMLGVEPIRSRNTYSAEGTRIKAWLNEYFDVESAIEYINRCELSVKVKLFVVDSNGERTERKLHQFRTNKPLKKLDFGELFVAKSTDKSQGRIGACVIRINGLALFEKSLSTLKYDFALELSGLTDPKDPDYPLNVQREGFSWKTDYIIDAVLDAYKSEPNKVVNDTNKNDNLITVQRGCGKTPDMASLMYSEDALVIETVERDGMEFHVPSYMKDKATELIDKMSAEQFGDFVASVSTSNTERIVDLSETSIMMERVKLNFEEQSVFSDIYPYDFIIKGKTNLRYNGIKYRRFCLLWHKMIQYVLWFNMANDNEINIGEYKIGFVFPSDDSIKAQYTEIDGSPCLLLNPDININSIAWRGVVLEVMDRAIHEITHKFHEYHDGSFMCLYNSIKANCYANIEEIFAVGGAILKSNKEGLMEAAMMDECYTVVCEEDE